MAVAALSRYCLPATTKRAYSSFFSGGGGGRYFNSAKPPKSVVPSGNKGTTTNAGAADPTNDIVNNASSNSGADIEGKDGAAVDGGAQKAAAADKAGPTPASAPPSGTSQQYTYLDRQSAPPSGLQYLRQPSLASITAATHPSISAKDFKLHSFFALHRPMLLINDPATIFAPPSSTGSLFTSTLAATDEASALPPALSDPKSLLHSGQATSCDDTVDASLDADAEAARQLSHALTLSRAGATASWESTLNRLGLNPHMEHDIVALAERMKRDLEDVEDLMDGIAMDSTKRKRAKKMKKHK